MTDIVNLRLARKARKRAEAEAEAAENRARSGRTRAQKDRDAREDALAKQRLDQHKRGKPSE